MKKSLSKKEKQAITTAIIDIEDDVENFSCIALKRAGRQLGMNYRQQFLFCNKYINFFGTSFEDIWHFPDGQPLGLSPENKEIRLLLLTMFKELYGKVKL